MSDVLILHRYQENWGDSLITEATIPVTHLLYWEPIELNEYKDPAKNFATGKIAGSKVWLCTEGMKHPAAIFVTEAPDAVTQVYADAKSNAERPPQTQAAAAQAAAG